MSNEVAQTGNAWVIPHKEADESLALMSAPAFLPRLQFITKMSKYTELTPGIAVNHFGVIASDDDYHDVDLEVDAMVIGWRQKALNCNEGKSYYDHKSAAFIETQTSADTIQDSGCMYGPEYLLYLPDTDKLVTFFFGSKSLRYEVRKIHALYDSNSPVTFFGKKITPKGSTKSYHSATVKSCVSPIAQPDADRMKQIIAELERFNNPTSSEPPAAASQVAAPASNRAR